MAEVTPDTIRYYEKQQMWSMKCVLKVGFACIPKAISRIEIYPPCQTTRFQSRVDPRVLSIRIDPEHHTCQESKGIVRKDCRKSKHG